MRDEQATTTNDNDNATTTKTLTPNDFLVQGLEKVIPAYAEFDGTMYAGLLPMDNTITMVDPTDETNILTQDRYGKTMFWFFQPNEPLVPNSITIWLNGGPGCSSFNCGVLMEHSPVTQPLHDAGYCCIKNSQPEFHKNDHAWTQITNMLYIEHPIGTGFSYGFPYPDNEAQASGDLDAFLQNFFAVFDHLQGYDFYVTGESYAGMFVPSIARYIHNANKQSRSYNAGTPRIPIRLKGAALGNGWIDAKIQGPATIDYSWWHGLIDKPTRDALHHEWENCMLSGMQKTPTMSALPPQPPPFHPFTVQDDCGIMWGILLAAGNPNAYDVTTWDPNVDQITFASTVFYNSDEVKTALHAPKNITWHGCQGFGRRKLAETGSTLKYPLPQPHVRRLYMDNDRPLSVVPYIYELIEDGIPVIVYNGDRDMTTNMVGSELALNDMMEKHGKLEEWLEAPRGLWMVKDYPGGWAKELGNLKFVVVYNSGHMVPYNRPDSGIDLLTRLLTQQDFVDVEAPKIRVNRVPIITAQEMLAQLSTTTTTTASMENDPEDDDEEESIASLSNSNGNTNSNGNAFMTTYSKLAMENSLVQDQPQLQTNPTTMIGVSASHVRWESACTMALVSMIFGAVMALLGHRMLSKSRIRRSYQRVPENNDNDEDHQGQETSRIIY